MFGGTGTDPMMKFRVSSWYEGWNASTGAISAAWAKEKNAGNALLKEKKYALAVAHYTKAYQYAVGVFYNGSVEQFLLHLKGSDRPAGMQAVGTNIFLLKTIFVFVRDPGVFRIERYSQGYSSIPKSPLKKRARRSLSLTQTFRSARQDESKFPPEDDKV